ncbi:MAG: stage II sporulation protein P [Bacilli bacterium]|nr:stage II sporulation protein P [Bacilli bacterium]
MKRIKKRVKKRKVFSKIIIFLLLIYFSAYFTYNNLCNINIKINNESFLQLLLTEGNHHILTKLKPKKIFSDFIYYLINVDINKPATVLGINFFDQELLAANAEVDGISQDNYNPDELEKVSEYIKDPNPSTVSNPRIYIYNTHQLENYDPEYLEIYNIKPNVLMASYMLKEKLNNLGIPSLVEETNITEFMRINNWKHADSYKASRILIIDNKNKYDSIEYFIDVHRDSIRKKASTVTINGKKYARTLFVIGLENPNYKKNLKMAEELDALIKKHYPGLSRGIMKKQGKGVNGVYNQDLSPKMMLLEVGGVDNNIEEVLNTIEAFSQIFYKYVVSK